MKKLNKDKPLSELQAEWDAILKADGFQDIEDTSNPDRPLKEWHSRKFISDRSRIRQEAREKYNQMVDDFINSSSINEICELIVKHGNSALVPSQVKRILEMHRNGLTERKIAARIKCGKKCVHLTIKKAREWMEVA